MTIVNSSAEPRNVVLSYHKSDIERRFRIATGKYTQVNTLFSGLAAGILTAGVFLLLGPWSPDWAAILLQRGAIPYFVVFFTMWALVILFVKRQKLKLQRRVLTFDLIPIQTDFVLSVDTVSTIYHRIYELVDDPERFCLYKRILTGINSIRNLGRISDVGEVMRAQAESDEANCETSFALIRGFLWGIPVLGFIGTVLGLSQAIGGFGDVLSSAQDIAAITGSLKGVTAGLATAFDTTLLALICALAIQFLITFVKKQEEEFLDDCSDYCQTQIIDRIKVAPETSDIDEATP